MEAYLKKTYYDLAHPAGYSSVAKLRKAAQDAGFREASYGKVKKWLLQQETYGLTKTSRRKFPRSKVVVAGIDAQWGGDLIDFRNIASSNDGFSYILVLEDMFSRYCWTAALKRKTPGLVAVAMDRIFREGRSPKFSFYTD